MKASANVNFARTITTHYIDGAFGSSSGPTPRESLQIIGSLTGTFYVWPLAASFAGSRHNLSRGPEPIGIPLQPFPQS
jgi:hypothetical protein